MKGLLGRATTGQRRTRTRGRGPDRGLNYRAAQSALRWRRCCDENTCCAIERVCSFDPPSSSFAPTAMFMSARDKLPPICRVFDRLSNRVSAMDYECRHVYMESVLLLYPKYHINYLIHLTPLDSEQKRGKGSDKVDTKAECCTLPPFPIPKRGNQSK